MKDNRLYILHIKDAISSIEKFIKDVKESDFLKNDMMLSAVIRKIEIIGEAVKHLNENFQKKHQEIPWKQIAGMRDKLIHDYFGVDSKRVWEVTQKDIPILKGQILKILKEDNSSNQLELNNH
jgi:uncharacterized protein with HEPN domain